MKILFLLGEEFEHLEFFYPYYRVMEGEPTPVVAWKEKGGLTGKHGCPIDTDIAFRDDKNMKSIAKEFLESRKPVEAICHGPQIMISAGVVKGKAMTSFISVKDELVSVGANYEDKEVVIDENLVSSRQPGDLPKFTNALLTQLRNKEKSINDSIELKE